MRQSTLREIPAFQPVIDSVDKVLQRVRLARWCVSVGHKWQETEEGDLFCPICWTYKTVPIGGINDER